MKCNCDHENEQGSKFCEKCGAKLNISYKDKYINMTEKEKKKTIGIVSCAALVLLYIFLNNYVYSPEAVVEKYMKAKYNYNLVGAYKYVEAKIDDEEYLVECLTDKSEDQKEANKFNNIKYKVVNSTINADYAEVTVMEDTKDPSYLETYELVRVGSKFIFFSEWIITTNDYCSWKWNW